MDRDGSSSTGRKLKYAPRAPRRRKPQSTPSKTEAGDDDGDSEQVQHLLRQFNENLGRHGPKVEKKSKVQVAFGPGAESSSSIRTYGIAQGGTNSKRNDAVPKDSDNEEFLLAQSTALQEGGTGPFSVDSPNESPKIAKKEFKEPYDYHHSYYPMTHPLCRPDSGDPELVDEEEYGQAGSNAEYDENIKPASELGLLEESNEKEMFFFQLPASLPVLKRSTTTRKGKEKIGDLGSAETKDASNNVRGLEELPGGYMGKMLVYKSGAIKLKLGDILYDVSPGSQCSCPQDVAAINTADRHCCVLGELHKRAVVTPDVDFLVNNVIDLDK